MHNYSIILFIFAALLHKYTSMSTKKERLDAICRIIQTEKIGNQEELLNSWKIADSRLPKRPCHAT